MASKIILIDTSILIEYFRKTDKSNSTLYKLYAQDYDFCVSAITESELKQKRKQIGIADLLIASTAISNKLRFATLNKKHFDRIESIEMID
jgi:tRNA(fMet)-specific endonuclease VapC